MNVSIEEVEAAVALLKKPIRLALVRHGDLTLDVSRDGNTIRGYVHTGSHGEPFEFRLEDVPEHVDMTDLEVRKRYRAAEALVARVKKLAELVQAEKERA